jgi:DNA helicase II / ATP-dependent DNA helicase PcrA
LSKIDAMLQKLNTHQRQAVLDESRVTLVNANVGSGKTTVLIAKVLYQHLYRHVPLKDMVVLTFTNKAAKEIKDRMTAAEPEIGNIDMPWFGTFHSTAMRMLQTILPVERLGYTAAFTILDPDELPEIATRLIAEHGLCIKHQKKLEKRLEAYQLGQPLYGAMKNTDDIGRLWELITQEKIRQNKMDFDDLIRNAARLLQGGTGLSQWVIVDEFQDCDRLQLEFIKALLSDDTKLFAVGDPNQIIYSWRGSNRNIFTEFKKDYQVKELPLSINYRSSSTILAAAKSFLENHSELEGVREPGCGIVVRNHYNPFLEADYLADKINRLHDSGVAYQNIAVFYRLQRQSKALTGVFEREGIPYEVSVRKTLKDIPVLQWFMRLLSAAVNETDRTGLIPVLTDTRFGEGLTLSQAKKIIDAGRGGELYEKIRGFSKWAVESKTADSIYGYFGLDGYLAPTSNSFQENRGYVLTLLKRLEEYLGEKNVTLSQGLTAFLNSATLYGADILKEDSPVPADTVKLMTLHACKGLEFQYVFIIGVNYGLIPLPTALGKERNQSQEPEEEEKRLFFVGITRARDCLELSYYTSPDDLRVAPGESNYLAMIPRSLLEYEEENHGGQVDLQVLRRAVRENLAKNKKADLFPAQKLAAPKAAGPQPAENAKQKVRHLKYGPGLIESEDEESFTVSFENYGLKAFSKDFCPLEFLGPECP